MSREQSADSATRVIKSLTEEFAEVFGIAIDDGMLRDLLQSVLTRKLEDYIESRTKTMSLINMLEMVRQLTFSDAELKDMSDKSH